MTMEESIASIVSDTVRRVLREELPRLAPKSAPPPQPVPAPREERMLSTAEVAERTGMKSTDTVVKWIKAGHLKGVKAPGGHNWAVAQSEFERFLLSWDGAAKNEQPEVQPDEAANRILQKLAKR